MSEPGTSGPLQPGDVVSSFNSEDINHFFYLFNAESRENWNKNIEEWTKIFGYAGFDPCTLFAHIQNIYKTQGKMNQFVTDMGKLVLVFIRRGSNISKIIEKTEGPGKEELTILMKMLDIQVPAKRGQKLPKNVVSLPRIAALFPFLSTVTIKAAVPELIDELCRAYHLPTWAATPSLLSMFPVHNDFRPLTQIAMMLSFIYNYALATYLHKQDKAMPGPNVATIWNIIHSSHQTKYMKDETRVDALWRTGILRRDLKIKVSYPLTYPGLYLDGIFNHSLPINMLKRFDPTTHAALLSKLQSKLDFQAKDQEFTRFVEGRRGSQYGAAIPYKVSPSEVELADSTQKAVMVSGLLFDSTFADA